MEPLSIAQVRLHPELLHSLQLRARRARAEHLHSMFARLAARLARRGPRTSGGFFGRLHWG